MLMPLSLYVHGNELFRAEGGSQNIDPIIVGPYPFALLVEGVHSVSSIRTVVNKEFQ